MKTSRPRRTTPVRSTLARLGLAGLGLTLALTGCSAPGSGASKPAESTAAADRITAPITADQVSSLGQVTLHVWADQGEESLMKLIVPKYEQEFTNVKVDIQYKSFNDLTATVVNALNSTDAPDVAQGNQGWATDGALVKAGLVRQLDDVADAYGYRQAAGSAISQLQWSPDGKTFGSGTVYGLSPDNQMVGIFYNKAKLADLGLQAPATFDDLTAALGKAKTAGEVPLMLGNSDKATAMQAFSVVQGAMTPAADTVGWITGKAGSDFNNATNQKALDTWTSWVKDGYVADGYDARSPDDAAAAFAKGQGVFLIAGNWQAGTVSDGAKFGFIAAPKSGANQAASSGSFGLNWHLSAKTRLTPAAIAFVGMINDPKNASLLAQVNRVPIATDGVTSTDVMFNDLLKASGDQLSSNGSLYWYDWATNTMFDTFTSGLQELMDGRTSSTELLTTVQQDWTEFQSKK